MIANEAPTLFSIEYFDFAEIFSSELILELPEHTGINNHTMELVDNKQQSYGPIYSLKPIELETLKTSIKTNLANNFIRPSKFSIGASIFFDKKPNRSF